MKIACLDIETLGVESTSVILSVAIGFADVTQTIQSIEKLRENIILVKFSTKDQIENYNRTIDKDTIIWWKKQCDIAKNCSFLPSKTDLSVKNGIEVLKKHVYANCDPNKTLCFIRGSLDQLAIDSLFKKAEESVIFPYFVYRDCRTYIEYLAENPKNGYCDINKTIFPDYDKENIIKHMPQDDVLLDLAMILSC